MERVVDIEGRQYSVDQELHNQMSRSGAIFFAARCRGLLGRPAEDPVATEFRSALYMVAEDHSPVEESFG